MSDKSANLKLPFIQSAQAQKHVTHNDAITNLDILTQLTVEDKDLSTPPSLPVEGACFIIASTATAEWAGKENQIAAWQDGAWRFYEPAEGWVAWIIDEDTQVVFDGTLWNVLTSSGGGSTNLNPVTGDLLGVNATADTTNKFSVNSDATLFNNNGSDHQLKINKNSSADNASVMFQTGFEGRAEFGLTGDDDFHMKVSPNGTTFHEGIVIDKDTGAVTFPNTTFAGGSVSSVFGRAGAVVATTGDYSFDEIGGVSQNVLIGRLTSGTGVQEALSAAQVRSFINVEDNATADLTGTEIKALYEAVDNTNPFDDNAVSKLSAIEPLADVTDEANVIAAISGAALTNVAINSTDKVIIQDVSDGDILKSVTAQSIADLSTNNAGDVFGPSSSSDFRIALFDGITGKGIKELQAGSSGQFLKSQGVGITPVWETISGGGDLLAANNLSDISNAVTARNNLGLEIGVDVAAAGVSNQVSSDLLMMALRLADLEGDALGLVDGIADPFDDETDIDTIASIGQTYNSSDDSYSNVTSASVIPGATGTPIGSMTGGGGLATSFDGNTSQSYTTTSNADGGEGYIGKTFSSGKKISSVTVYSTNNFGFAGGASGNLVITLYGKNGAAPSNSTDGTNLGETAPFTDSNTLLTKTISSSDLETSWDHIWVRITDSNLQTLRIAEVVFTDGGSATNMTVISDIFTANSTPSSARLIFFIKPVENITINADVIGSISRDNGTTYTNATFTEVIEYSNGIKVYEAETVDISSQPSGTSMKWKLTTANNKSIEYTGVVLQWS